MSKFSKKYRNDKDHHIGMGVFSFQEEATNTGNDKLQQQEKMVQLFFAMLNFISPNANHSKHQADTTAILAPTKCHQHTAKLPLVIERIRNMWHVMIFQGTLHRSNIGGGFASLIVDSFVSESCC
jgi:hypothetical protein